MKNIAVVLAGGVGKRLGAEKPKQFLPLGGRTLIEWSVDVFDRHPAIDEVAVVVHPDWRAEMETLRTRNEWRKLTRLIDGGSERYMSSLNAVMAYLDYPDETNLLLHDAARPLLPAAVVDRVVAALQHHEAVGVAVPSTDTVWEVRPDLSGEWRVESGEWRVESGERRVESGEWRVESGEFEVPRFVARIPERRTMWLAQTPQAFRLPLIRDAYQRALQDPQFAATDDCGVVRRYMPEVKVTVVEGDTRNFKITTLYDLQLAQNVI